jgi:1,4-alpha-glucan branching enzyme
MIDLSLVGAHAGKEHSTGLQLGIFLPGISQEKGYRLYADIIHSMDQFTPEINSFPVELTEKDKGNGLWQFQGNMATLPPTGNLGKPGRHLYRYRLLRHDQVVVPAFADPYAVLSGIGTNSAFDFLQHEEFSWTDDGFTVPDIRDLIMYEMMVDDFADDFEGVLERLTYLESLGVNCIELMPVTNIPEPYRWGYMPMSFFAIEERYGGKEQLKKLVNACHERGIAVIHDAVYAHMHEDFCYRKVYWETGEDNPMIGPFAGDMFGVGTDFNREFTYDYFMAVNRYFLDELHFDGFRYDYVPGIYDGPAGKGYARLVYNTYQYSKDIPRFQGGQHSTIIQAAEYLDMPKKILQQTYTTASKRWQPMLKAQYMVKNYGTVPEDFVHEMLLMDFSTPWPSEYHNEQNNEKFPVVPLQFLECHDKSRLMYLLSGEHSSYQGGFDLFNRDKRNWYRLQPFAIALMTAEGVPLLWQGQEFGEIYGKHDDGGSRVLAARPLHWNFFYEKNGRILVNLYRRLGQLRHRYQALRSRQSYYYHEHSRLDKGLVAFLRISESSSNVLVLINFSEQDAHLTVPLESGQWHEQLVPDSEELLSIEQNGEYDIFLPANYGKIFAKV